MEDENAMRYMCSNCKKDCQHLLGDLCQACYALHERIKVQLIKARKNGEVADLTLAQYTQMLKHFKHRCAYCDTFSLYLFIEHFVPIGLGAGTTASNCVPACNRCNSRKRRLHPDHVTLIAKPALKRVYEYLANIKNSS